MLAKLSATPRLDVCACVGDLPTHSCKSLAIFLSLFLPRAFSFCLSRDALLPICLSRAHISSLSITDFSLLSSLSISAPRSNDNPVLISSQPASVSPTVACLHERARVTAKSAKFRDGGARWPSSPRRQPLAFPTAENVKRIANPWNFPSSRR